MRIFRKMAIREASFLQTLSACALKESVLSIFRPKSETQSTLVINPWFRQEGHDVKNITTT